MFREMEFCLCFLNPPVNFREDFINVIFGILVNAPIGAVAQNLQSLEDRISPCCSEPLITVAWGFVL